MCRHGKQWRDKAIRHDTQASGGALARWLTRVLMIVCLASLPLVRQLDAEAADGTANSSEVELIGQDTPPPAEQSAVEPSSSEQRSDSQRSAEQVSRTRAFRMPTPEATHDAVRSIWIIGGIAAAGVLVIFLGAYYFYTLRACQRPYRPTVIPESPPLQ